VAGSYFAVFILVVVAARGETPLTSAFPPAAGRAVAEAAAARPGTTIYSNERFGDWLLFTHPELEGRIAFDARFELLDARQLQQIFDWTNQLGDHWRRAAARSGIVVLDMEDEQGLARTLTTDSRLRRSYADAHTAVFLSTRSG